VVETLKVLQFEIVEVQVVKSELRLYPELHAEHEVLFAQVLQFDAHWTQAFDEFKP
jgi:hypothetical protein